MVCDHIKLSPWVKSDCFSNIDLDNIDIDIDIDVVVDIEIPSRLNREPSVNVVEPVCSVVPDLRKGNNDQMREGDEGR